MKRPNPNQLNTMNQDTITLNCSPLDLLTFLQVFSTHRTSILDVDIDDQERMLKVMKAAYAAIEEAKRKENA